MTDTAHEEDLARVPRLASEDTPCYYGWSDPSLGDHVASALDDIEGGSTQYTAWELSEALLHLRIRHIVHYDSGEKALTLRLDKHGAGLLADHLKNGNGSPDCQ